MSAIVREVDLPGDLAPDAERYSGHAFRPAVLVERVARGSWGESYGVKVKGPRLKKDGGDHATAQGINRYADAAGATPYDEDVAGTQYARFLVGRAALGALLVAEVTA